MGVSGVLLLTLAPGPFVFGLFPHLEGATAVQTAGLMAVGLLSVCMSVMTLLSPAETDWNGED